MDRARSLADRRPGGSGAAVHANVAVQRAAREHCATRDKLRNHRKATDTHTTTPNLQATKMLKKVPPTPDHQAASPILADATPSEVAPSPPVAVTVASTPPLGTHGPHRPQPTLREHSPRRRSPHPAARHEPSRHSVCAPCSPPSLSRHRYQPEIPLRNSDRSSHNPSHPTPSSRPLQSPHMHSPPLHSPPIPSSSLKTSDPRKGNRTPARWSKLPLAALRAPRKPEPRDQRHGRMAGTHPIWTTFIQFSQVSSTSSVVWSRTLCPGCVKKVAFRAGLGPLPAGGTIRQALTAWSPPRFEHPMCGTR